MTHVVFSGIKFAGVGTQRDLAMALEVSGGMHIIPDTNPQCAACALVGGKRGEQT